MTAALIAHVIYRLQVGGLENGLANLVSHLPRERFRHAIVSLTDATEFASRLPDDVPVISLHKREGNDLRMHRRLLRSLRGLRPSIVHTRNLAALEGQLAAAIAGVSCRIHGEHGWDVFDPHGKKRRYIWLRRGYRPLVHRYVPMSRHLTAYLTERIGIPAERICQIYNGVDTRRFHPDGARARLPARLESKAIVIGTVGRMHGVKDQLALVRAFCALCQDPEARSRTGLVLVGDGPLRGVAAGELHAAGLLEHAWLPGVRDDIPELMRRFEIFVLPSLAEGISNTILEAMASGLPVVATDVGGNPELVEDGCTGTLVPPRDADAMARALAEYVADDARRHAHGARARERAVERFGLDRMIGEYESLYTTTMEQRRCAA